MLPYKRVRHLFNKDGKKNLVKPKHILFIILEICFLREVISTLCNKGGKLTFSSEDDDHHPSLKKSIAPLLHIVIFLISAGIGPFLHDK